MLPFDHRASSSTACSASRALSTRRTSLKSSTPRGSSTRVFFALETDVPRDAAAILVDEQFGREILRDANARGLMTACPVERSGEKEFTFEYGSDFAAHVEDVDPTFCKALVRYNPEGDRRAQSSTDRTTSSPLRLPLEPRSRLHGRAARPSRATPTRAGRRSRRVRLDDAPWADGPRHRGLSPPGDSANHLENRGPRFDDRLPDTSQMLPSAKGARTSDASCSAGTRPRTVWSDGFVPPPQCPRSSGLPWAAAPSPRPLRAWRRRNRHARGGRPGSGSAGTACGLESSSKHKRSDRLALASAGR